MLGESGGERIEWSGPILAGDRLYLAGSESMMLAISPKTGDVLEEIAILDRVFLPPVVAGKTLYLLNNDGELAVYQ